jgi:hypothetical protein
MFGSLWVYIGLAITFVGLTSLLRPLRLLGIRTRGRACVLVLIAAGFVALGLTFPATDNRIQLAQTRLDEFAPVYQFCETHAIAVNAPPERVFESMRAVTAREILFFRTLMRIRRLGHSGPERTLQAPEQLPLLDVATRTTFLMLAQEPGRELVIGTIVLAPLGTEVTYRNAEAFKALTQPGFVKATMNFLVRPLGSGGSLLSTETRVFATDASSRRRFAAYWRLIYPGSALIRRMWLRAIKLRAEQK